MIADARQPKKEQRSRQGGVAIGKAFVPLAFALGEEFQLNWSEQGLVIGGIYRKLQVAHMAFRKSVTESEA